MQGRRLRSRKPGADEGSRDVPTAMGQSLAIADAAPGGAEGRLSRLPVGPLRLMPRALVEAAAAMGVELSGTVQEAAGLLVAGTLSPRSRFKYGYELIGIAEWCDEHGLELLNLSPLDIAAMAVARRSVGIDPRNLIDAMAFVDRHKPGGPDNVVGLARRADRVWRRMHRDVRPPTRRAPVLPLQCWLRMRAAADASGYTRFRSSQLRDERVARDRLIISLGLSGGLDPESWGASRRPTAA